MNLIDRWYVAWRVLRGEAVEVRSDFNGDRATLTVTFRGGSLVREKRKRTDARP